MFPLSAALWCTFLPLPYVCVSRGKLRSLPMPCMVNHDFHSREKAFARTHIAGRSRNYLHATEGYDVTTFEFPSQKKEGKGGWEPSFASNLILNFRVLIRPYWPGQVQSYIKDIQIDLQYKNQNVRERKALNKGQSLISCTLRNI